MNQLFGSPAVWQAKFAQVFENWSRVCGIRYIPSSDDGAPWPESQGVLGVRGDIRICAAPMDGPYGVLGRDYMPDVSDMILDADENWASSSYDYIWFRQVIAHEHGHGIGLHHVCPANNTKLMEPYLSTNFDGPQHDDIRGGQRYYGDRFENNDNVAAASGLQTISRDTAFTLLSIDGFNDTDYYRFVVPAGQGITITLIPVGQAYLEGPQNGDQSCSPGTWISTLDDINLELRLYNANGGILLAQSAAHPAGEPEEIYHYNVSSAGDSFIVRISGSGGDEVQIYTLQFDLFNLFDPYLSVCPVLFDTIAVGDSEARTTYLVNPTAVPLTVYSIAVDAPFTISPNAPQTIAPYGSLALNIGFSPLSHGVRTGNVNITHSATGSPILCAVNAVAVTSWLHFIAPANVDFGDVPLGEADSFRFPVRARGNLPLTITAVAVAAPFSMNLSVPYVLEAEQAITLYPRFTPSVVGEANGTLILFHTGTNSPDTMFLRGTCVPRTADERNPSVPAEFRVHQNYPNPFNATTRIAFDLPRAADVSIRVFDIQGRLVRELTAGNMAAGRREVFVDATGLSSGVYLYRITTPEHSGTGKMMLLK